MRSSLFLIPAGEREEGKKRQHENKSRKDTDDEKN